MPIDVRADLVEMTQARFATIAYEVMSKAFAVHKELGNLFDEAVYRNALADRLNDVVTEVQIDVRYRDFCKVYFMDALVVGGAVFELKAVKELHESHRSQLLHYLLLADLHHGTLINFGTGTVEHEFVNAPLTHEDRRSFAVEDRGWIATDGFGSNEKDLLLDILRNWGAGLDGALYREALLHFLGGADRVLTRLDVHHDGRYIGQQTIPITGDSTGFRLTTFQNGAKPYRQDLIRLMQATRIKSLQWINVSRKKVTFETLNFFGSNFSVSHKMNPTAQNIPSNSISIECCAAVPGSK